jgi:hypothetical protein
VISLCSCGREAILKQNTVCRRCYRRWYRANKGKATCHPDKQEYAGELCRSCYVKNGGVSRAVCHPERLPISNGLCAICYKESPEVKERARITRRATKYKLTNEQFISLLTKQNNRCYICETIEPSHVDHDHATGAVRGILCRQCNTGLGQFRDSTELLRKAIIYLDEYTKNK